MEEQLKWRKSVEDQLLLITKAIDRLAKVVNNLGCGCREAFKQVKAVVEHLTEAVDGTRQDLSEYGCTITQSTWDVTPNF